jgi:hypothetical protein
MEGPLVQSVMELKRIKDIQLRGYIFPARSAESLQIKGVTFADFFQFITDTQYTLDGATKLLPFENCSSLESLKILNCHLENQEFPPLTQLKVLVIGDCLFDEETLKSLIGSVSQISLLEEIRLILSTLENTERQHCLQTSHLSRLLTQPSIQQSLQRLTIRGMRRTAERMQFLSPISSLQQLKQLDLSLEPFVVVFFSGLW